MILSYFWTRWFLLNFVFLTPPPSPEKWRGGSKWAWPSLLAFIPKKCVFLWKIKMQDKFCPFPPPCLDESCCRFPYLRQSWRQDRWVTFSHTTTTTTTTTNTTTNTTTTTTHQLRHSNLHPCYSSHFLRLATNTNLTANLPCLAHLVLVRIPEPYTGQTLSINMRLRAQGLFS